MLTIIQMRVKQLILTPGLVIKAWIPTDDTLEVKKNSIDVSHKLLNHIIKLPNIDYKYVSTNDWKNQKFDPIEIGKEFSNFANKRL